jgi:penicillin-insensitive murein endopeptidase
MFKTLVLFVAAMLCAAATAWATTPKDWGGIDHPSTGAPQVIGTPAAGCLAGAEPLDLEGEGFEVLRPERHRFFGHPKLLRFIHWLGHAAAQASLGTLLVGDLSQPRGGPKVYGHGSHQNGLDADIMFQVADGPISAAQRANPAVASVVKGRDLDPDRWSERYARLLEITAESPEVERIFVNPAIKQALCRQIPPDKRAWLRKLRPWWGHDDHFHVRLGCPEGSTDCKPQPPPPDGDGCGFEVESWLERPTLNIPVNKPNSRNVSLPKECSTVLHAH